MKTEQKGNMLENIAQGCGKNTRLRSQARRRVLE